MNPHFGRKVFGQIFSRKKLDEFWSNFGQILDKFWTNFHSKTTRANPTIASYNASAAKIYNPRVD
jgi:hypothetical protein